ncbi:hypothetical protein D3C81_1557360 [compost metagenome]
MPWHGDHFLIISARAEVARQLFDIIGEVVSAAGALAAQGAGGHLVGARCAAQAQVDAAWVEAGQGAELLGDHQRRVVGQHHTTGADPDGRGAARQVADQHRGRGTGNAIHVVVLSDPEAVIAEAFCVLRQVQRVTQRLGRPAVGAHGHQVEGGYFQVTQLRHGSLRKGGWPEAFVTLYGHIRGIQCLLCDWSELAVSGGPLNP